MRWISLGVGVAAALLATLGHAAEPADERAADRRIIMEGERAWCMAFVTGDGPALSRLLDDSFRGVAPSGSFYDKAEAVGDVSQTPHQSIPNSIDDITVRFYDDTAIVQAHERGIGPSPEQTPEDLIFTDTWIKRDGRWRIVAAEDVDRGSPSPPNLAPVEREIRALRAASNRAIAAHDLKAFLPLFAEDAGFVFSNATTAADRKALEAVFVRDFADPAFVTYIRSPQRISIAENGVRAVEHGVWTAIKQSPAGETRYGGDYAAHWVRDDAGWRIHGELYVKLRCTGPLCTP